MASWTNTQKSGGSSSISAGMPIGLLLILTYASSSSGGGVVWTHTSESAAATFTKLSHSSALTIPAGTITGNRGPLTYGQAISIDPGASWTHTSKN